MATTWLVGQNTAKPFPKTFKTKKEALAYARLYFAGTGQVYFVWKQKPGNIVQFI